MNKDIIGINISSKYNIITKYNKVEFTFLSNGDKDRIIPTVISYGDRIRNFGEAAFIKNGKNYRSSNVYPNPWLGIKYNEPIISQDSQLVNFSPKKNDFDDTLGFIFFE